MSVDYAVGYLPFNQKCVGPLGWVFSSGLVASVEEFQEGTAVHVFR